MSFDLTNHEPVNLFNLVYLTELKLKQTQTGETMWDLILTSLPYILAALILVFGGGWIIKIRKILRFIKEGSDVIDAGGELAGIVDKALEDQDLSPEEIKQLGEGYKLLKKELDEFKALL